MDAAAAGFHASVCSGAHAASGKIDILMADEHHEPDRPPFALTAPHALRSPHPLTQARAHPVLKARSGQRAGAADRPNRSSFLHWCASLCKPVAFAMSTHGVLTGYSQGCASLCHSIRH